MAKVKTEVRQLTHEELGQWGIFISHSGGETDVSKLCAALDRNGIRYLWDRQIEVGAEDFAIVIQEMINQCTAAIVVINQKAINSQWVNYEMGLLEGLNKHIYLYDPENLLEHMEDSFHYDRYCPAYTGPDALCAAVHREKLFYGLFNNATAFLTNEMFRQKMDENVIPVCISISIPELSSIPAEKFAVKALIINFGNFTQCRHTEESICCQTMEDIPEDRCEITGMKCCLNAMPDRTANPECVLLNHVWENVLVEGNTIRIILPLHRTAGTTFKLFIDTEFSETADQLMTLLNGLDLNPSFSRSGTQNRVYFVLRTNAVNGIFKLKDPYVNNFICPGTAQL